MSQLLCTAAYIYLLLIFGRIILSWFPLSPDSPMTTVYGFLHSATEPILGPLRRLMPPVNLGGMALDLSPIIVLFAMRVIVMPLVC